MEWPSERRPYRAGAIASGFVEMISIRDVGPRDGLQNELPLAPHERLEFAIALADAGVRDVEAAAFVSRNAVPAMAYAGDVVAGLPRRSEVRWWALVPNTKGAALAIEAGVTHLTVTISVSDEYSRRNVGISTAGATEQLCEIAALVGTTAKLDVVLSCAFGSPFNDVTSRTQTVLVVNDVLDAMPAARITLADTTGTATPRRITAVVADLPGASHRDLGLHLHDTRGTALANALAAIELGVRRFDTSTGGLGGSPFAPGAGGNLATEDLVLMLDDLGIATGIDLDAILSISRGLPDRVGHPMPSRVTAAGQLPPFS